MKIEEFGDTNAKRHHEAKEESLQESCMTYTRMQYPKSLAVHIPNESRAKPQYRQKLTRLGLVSGMPDIMIFEPSGGYFGLAVELKRKYKKPRDTQLECLERLARAGWYATWLRSFDNYKLLIDAYMKAEL